MHSARDLVTRWPALDAAARRARLHHTFSFHQGPLTGAVNASASQAQSAADGLWRRDPATWSADAAVQKTIANRLGWLTSPALMADALARLQAFGTAIRDAGFTDVVLLGMGGSSLAPEVLRAILGSRPGWPRFHMIDSTDPAAVIAMATTPASTLFVLASKSGTTIEPNSLAAHFKQVLLDAGITRWADHFVAITDPDTELCQRAAREQFRETFVNPADIGGRYSALSYFGLVPAALMGHDVTALVGWAVAMLSGSDPGQTAVLDNPAVALGLAMAAGAKAGRDKVTLLVPSVLEPFGLWVEQLVAESTGKHGVGVVPIAGEIPGPADAYATDRLFVRLRLPGTEAGAMRDADVRALEAAGHPVIEIVMPEPAALGAEFVRWEIATAVAGALLGINPFDEPNVSQAKEATRVLLGQYKATGALPVAAPDRSLPSGVTLTLSGAARTALAERGAEAFLTLLGAGDYFGLLAYLGPDPGLGDELHALRHAVRDRTRAATMFGYGPRYLHSTGQLHKGGPNTGVFVVITATPAADVAIPGEPFSFGTLELAQGLGDFASLDSTGRRALHVHLPTPDRRLLHEVATSLFDGLSRTATR